MMRQLGIVTVLFGLLAAGCTNFGAASSISNPCPGVPDTVSGIPPAVSVTPSSPRIGQPFTVKMLEAKRNGNTEAWPPDGVYKVFVQQAEVDYNAGCGPQFLPVPPLDRAEIGSLTVVNGIGEATFELKADYGKVKPAASKAIFLYTEGASGGQGVHFVIGQP